MRLHTGHGPDILCAIAVNCVWGLAFVIPRYLADMPPAMVALGRYFFYGVVSAGILLWGARTLRSERIDWVRAFAYAFVGHVGYYIILVWGLSKGGVMVVAPILATLPVAVAIVGNALLRELRFRRLVVPLLLILVGITGVRIYQNGHVTAQGLDASDMINGALLALAALSMWTMYAVLNARYLKRSRISSVLWAQAMGFCCLLQVGIALPLWLSFNEQPAALFPSPDNAEAITRFLAGTAVLGVIVSWFATQVWNKVSRKLPITVSGQLLVVQSLAAIVYGSWLDQQIPAPIELFWVAVVVVGVVWGVNAAYVSNDAGAA